MARQTDGVDDTIDCGVITALQSATMAAMSNWIYRATTGTTCGFGTIFRGAGNLNSSFSNLWYSTGHVFTNCDTDATSGVGCNFLKDETGWHHLFTQFDGTQSTNATRLVMYWDGVAQTLAFSGTIPAALAATQGTFAFGRDNYAGGSGRFWAGRYADCAVWTGTVFTAAEIAAMARGVHAYRFRRASLQAYWPLWGLHTVEPDLSNMGFQGTVTGAIKVDHAPVKIFTRPVPAVIEVAAAQGHVVGGGVFVGGGVG